MSTLGTTMILAVASLAAVVLVFLFFRFGLAWILTCIDRILAKKRGEPWDASMSRVLSWKEEREMYRFVDHEDDLE